MPVLSYQVNAPGYGGINPKLVYIFTDDPVATVTATGYIDWLANQQGIYTGDVALVVTRETPTSTFGANFYEFQRVGMGPHWNLIPESGGTPPVDSVSGTLHEIIATPTTGNVVVSISPNAIFPGNASVNLPVGNTAQRAGAAGSIRFNSQLSQFEVTLDGATWIALTTGGAGTVSSVTGTTNEIVASPTTGNVIVSIANNPVLPGTAEVVLPTGTTGQRGSTAGGLRFNTQLNEIELTNNGTNWYPVSTGNDTVNSVSGTANRITVTGTNNAVVDIAANYVGQTSIVDLGVVTVGTWAADTIAVVHGGTSGTSFTKNAPICGGTSNTSVFQSADSGIANVGYVLTSRGDSTVPNWQVLPTPAGDLVTSTTLSTSDIRAMYGAPVQLLAGQGAHTLIIINQVFFEIIANTTAFGAGSPNGAVIQFGNVVHAGGSRITSMYSNGLHGNINQGEVIGVWSSGATLPNTGGTSAQIINVGVFVSNDTAAFTGGDMSMRITMYYRILPTII